MRRVITFEGSATLNADTSPSHFQTIGDLKTYLYSTGIARGATDAADVVRALGGDDFKHTDDELITDVFGEQGLTKENPFVMKRLVPPPIYNTRGRRSRQSSAASGVWPWWPSGDAVLW
ncbi:unnamed protein product [Vitrella brassicaformis CCMP3155]|uniref:Uncharacterized protein n=1 Tax=Vitrella brassicaformis (strain CCMP3155) TaxID=1169540 RepID=A0A0G4GP84_VITBC|nr:unnamed protein product [Vitrella brassicaformis CCMP3155]|eukprot:CEM32087.1 unnamed protein product [Vitrella brassicaformis CCMP3155]